MDTTTDPEPDTSAQGATSGDEPTGDGIDWKAKAREWERRAKANRSAADELAALQDSTRALEETLADLQSRHTEAETRALRSDIATKHGISAEDRDLFLTGSDEASLEAQAKRLAERDATNSMGNRAPKEGYVLNSTSSKDAAKREWLASLSGE